MAKPVSSFTDEMEDAVALCEWYADDLFEGEDRYTQVTTWQDGDFRVVVQHSKGYQHTPYEHQREVITYKHSDGMVVYADKKQMIDRHRSETVESRDLERFSEPGL